MSDALPALVYVTRKVATPPTREPVPTVLFVPCWKATVPVGVPPLTPFTVAVNVTC